MLTCRCALYLCTVLVQNTLTEFGMLVLNIYSLLAYLGVRVLRQREGDPQPSHRENP